jgi:hypothetical protein
MSEEHPVIPTRRSAGSLLRQMLLQELTIGDGPIGQMDMLSIIANAADWLDEAVAENATTALTDAEREAIRTAADAYAVRGAGDGRESVNAATLRGLLERLGGGR